MMAKTFVHGLLPLCLLVVVITALHSFLPLPSSPSSLSSPVPPKHALSNYPMVGFRPWIDTLLVIPGGGSGHNGYPEWTKTRTLAAHEHYLSLDKGEYNVTAAAFLALSAGSLNVGNRLQDDGRIVFECQPVIRHLLNLGVPSDRVYGDTFSWDTVTNGLTLRMYVQALLNPNKPLNVEVFISDFHLKRMKESFQWILSLEPSLVTNVHLRFHSVSSVSIMTNEELDERMKHEQNGVHMIQMHRENIKTLTEFYQFLLLGGHKGFSSYLSGSYATETTVGYK